VTVANAGPGIAYNVSLVDNLPAGLPTTGANSFTWTCAKVDKDSRCLVSGNASGSGNISQTIYRIAPSGSVKFTITGTIPVGWRGDLDNTATVTPATQSVDPGCSPNCKATVKLPALVTDLSVKKVASSTKYTVGSPLTYTVTVKNAGPNTATGATVSDILPAGLPTSGASAFTWTCVGTGGATCTASGIGNINDTVTVPKDGKVVYTVTGIVPLDVKGSLSNTATVAPPAGVYDANCLVSCSSSVTVANQPPTTNLTISKTADKAIFFPGAPITYTVTATNNSILGVSGVQVIDTLPSSLPTSGVNAFTWTCVAHDVEVSPSIPSNCPTASGTGSVNQTGISLSAGGTVVYTITGTVPTSVTTSLSNTATLFPHLGTNDPHCNPSCSSTVKTAAAKTELSVVTKPTQIGETLGGRSPVGGHIQYTFTVTNTGITEISNLVVHSERVGASCPTATLAPGESVTCVGTSLYKVTAQDVKRGFVPNQAIASGVGLYTGPVASASNRVVTPTGGYIPTDLGIPDGPRSHGINAAVYLSMFGSLGMIFLLTLRRRRLN